MAITPQQARAELARRELVRRGLDPSDPPPAPASPTKSLPRRALEAVVDSPAIPTIAGIGGAIAGGLATAPFGGAGAIPIAAVAGAGGEGLRQVAARGLGLSSPKTSQEAIDKIAKEGAIQAIGEAGGQAINYGLKASGADRLLSKYAIGTGRRALGFSKRFLNTEFSRREANQAARVALENDVIPWLGNPEIMLKKASKLANDAEKFITSKLKKIDFYKIAPDAELDVTNFGRVQSKGTERGIFADTVKPLVNKIKETIIDLYGRGATASEYNQAKNALGETINYFAESSGSQKIKKKLVRSMADTARSAIKKFLPDSYEEFLANQRISNASLNMIKGLNNEVAGQLGNRVVSPYAVLSAAGQAAAGSPKRALATLGIVEAGLRRGSGFSARLLNETSKSLAKHPTALGRFAQGTMGFGRTIIPKKTREENQ